MRNASQPEPFELVRELRTERETFASWYDRARMTLRSWVPSEPDVVVVRKAGEMEPAAAGAVAGAVGGVVMLAIATLLARLGGRAVDLASIIGGALSGQRFFGTTAFAAGLGFALLTGAAIGSTFAWITRRLRHLVPLMIFGLLLATATWMVVHVLALPRFAPWLAEALPFGPMIVASAVFGVVLSLELPLRTRRVT